MASYCYMLLWVATLGIIDILETVFPLALAEEDFTEMTGP